MRTKFLSLLTIIVILSSCHPQNKFESIDETLTKAEKNISTVDSTDLKKLETQMYEIQQDLEENRNKYTDEEVEEIGKLQGRYAALILKKGVNEIKDNLNNFKNQMKGFIEGLNTNSNK
jgi:peptidoglycan hydrolase CwlO-like protein